MVYPEPCWKLQPSFVCLCLDVLLFFPRLEEPSQADVFSCSNGQKSEDLHGGKIVHQRRALLRDRGFVTCWTKNIMIH